MCQKQCVKAYISQAACNLMTHSVNCYIDIRNTFYLKNKQKQNKTAGLLTGPALGGAGPNWEQFRSAQVPSQLAPRSIELGVGPNWEQLV